MSDPVAVALRRVAEVVKLEALLIVAGSSAFDGDVIDVSVAGLSDSLTAFGFDPVAAHRVAFWLLADAFLSDNDPPAAVA